MNPTKKRCHYDVLGVEETVSSDDLKKAYRKCALKWHPDKNLGNEEAHQQFISVHEAYTILSDPQERAWYDKHKDQILSDGTEEVEFINVYPYFTTSCFSGFDDDEKGFYAVYRELFQNIADEDIAAAGKTKETAPTFGTKDSSFPEVVEKFYNYWSQYCTKITFAWTDEKISREYGRKAIKFIQRENQKKRDKLKKDRNEEIRNLVSFVKKRDKRVTAWRLKMEEEKKEKEIRQEEQRKEQLLERKRMNETYEESDWSKFSAVEGELANLEKSLAEKFSEDSESCSEEEDSEEEEEEVQKVKSLYCVACRKLFQSEKAFQNHEGSKKHKQNVANLAKNNDNSDEEESEYASE